MSSYSSRFMRLIAIFGIFVLPVTALAACGNSSDEETNEAQVEVSSQSNDEESTEEETSEPEEESSAEEESEESTPEAPVDTEEENEESTPEPPVETEEENEESTPEAPVDTEEESEESTPEPSVDTEEASSEEQDAAIEAILTNTYSWGDGTAYATRQLQEILETNVDGTYGMRTRLAHLNALEERGLPTDNVPTEPTVPGQPTNVSVTADGSSFIIDWDPPADNGGSEITFYTVTSAQLSGVSCNRSAVDGVRNGEPCMFGSGVGVEPGVSYTFSITATNETGVSEPLISQATTLNLQEVAISLNLDSGSPNATFFEANNIRLDFSVNGDWNGGLRSYAELTGGSGLGWIYVMEAPQGGSATFTITNNTGYECIKLKSFKMKAEWHGIHTEEVGPELTNVVANMYAQGSPTAVSQSTGLSLGPFDLSQDFDDIESSIITVQTPNSPCDTATVTLVTQMDTSMIPDPCEIFYATPCYPRFEFYVDQIELIGYAAP